jgi:hypothetical protein
MDLRRASEAGNGTLAAALATAAAALVITGGASDVLPPVTTEGAVCLIESVSPLQGEASCDGDAAGVHPVQDQGPRQQAPRDPLQARRDRLRQQLGQEPRIKNDFLLEDCFMGWTLAGEGQTQLSRNAIDYLQQHGSREDLGLSGAERAGAYTAGVIGHTLGLDAADACQSFIPPQSGPEA